MSSRQSNFPHILRPVLVFIALALCTLALLHTALAHAAAGPATYTAQTSNAASTALYVGPARAVQALQVNAAQPLTLASADFDGDGVPDLATGYSDGSQGIVTVARGNIDALFPDSKQARQHRATSQGTTPAFLSPALVFSLPTHADFLAAGDFDADGRFDIVAATRGGDALYLLRGDGWGGFAPSIRLALPGRVTVMAAGEVNRIDGLTDMVVGVAANGEAKALVFEGPEGALKALPETFALTAEATSLAFGRISGGSDDDIAVGEGSQVLIIHGRDRKLTQDAEHRAQVKPAAVDTVSLPTDVKSLAVGDLLHDGKEHLAALGADGAVYIVDGTATATPGKTAGGRWTSRPLSDSRWSTAQSLVTARVSTSGADDLLVLDGSSHVVRTLVAKSSAPRKSMAAPALGKVPTPASPAAVSPYAVSSLTPGDDFAVQGEPVAVLPMRLGPSALDGLVVLSKGQAAPIAMAPQASQVFTVTNTADTGAGSLRQAILDANNNPGTDSIVFNIPTSDPGYDPVSGAFTITPTQPMDVFDPVVIDGYTQPGAAPNTQSTSDNAVLKIQLNGVNCVYYDSGVPTSERAVGLRVWAASSTIRGLVMNRFGDFAAIELREFSGGGHIVEGNFIGTDVTGMTLLTDITDGIDVDAGAPSTIGGTAPASRNVVVHSGIGGAITGVAATLQGNFVQLNAAGTAALGSSYAVEFATYTNTQSIVLGGTAPGAGNVVLRWSSIQGLGGGTALVQGNLFGTDPAGSKSLAGYSPITALLSATYATVGGTTPAARNLISGAGGYGLYVVTSTNVLGNYFGTDIRGTAAINNSKSLYVYGPGNTIGGADAAARNVFSSQIWDIWIVGSAAYSNTVQGNYIGTDASGAQSLGQNQTGIWLYYGAHDNLIGGSSPGTRNVIAGHDVYAPSPFFSTTGMQIDLGAYNNTIQGNYIGTGVNGTEPFSYTYGIHIDSAYSNTIGGISPGEGNLIANSRYDGVQVSGANNAGGNSIRGNSIVNSGFLGIDLLPYLEPEGQATLNDTGDSDTGANNLQNYPVITQITSSGGTTTINGTLNSVPNTNFALDFYHNSNMSASGYGEGETYIGSANVSTDGSGNTNFTFSYNGTASGFFAATATNLPTGDTSEFSQARALTNETPSLVVNTTADVVANDGKTSLREALIHADNLGGNSTVSFNIPANDPGYASSVYTISIASPLPMLGRDKITVDGTTQTAFTGNTNPNGPEIVVSAYPLFYSYSPSPNLSSGIFLKRINGLTVFNASNCVIKGLVINWYQLDGIALLGQGGSHIVKGNFVGIAWDGSLIYEDLGKGSGASVWVGNSNNVIGGTAPEDHNVISGNQPNLDIEAGANNNRIQGNYFGSDYSGTLAPGSDGLDMLVRGDDNLIGGVEPGAGNLSMFGIGLIGKRNTVQGNLIGTDATGAQHPHDVYGEVVRGNGVAISGTDNKVGGQTSAAANVISSLVSYGVSLFNPYGGVHGNVIEGNFIGTDKTGTVNLGNTDGVYAQGEGDVIRGNVIKFSTSNDGYGGNGIDVYGTNQTISQNWISDSDHMGIDFNGRATPYPNDHCDNDALGGNYLQNYPVISSAVSTVAGAVITGTLDSSPNMTYRLEFFSNDSLNAAGYAEGQTYLGSATAITTGSCTATFVFTTSVAVPVGAYLTSTATNPTGNTSEFSPYYQMVNGVPANTPTSTPTSTPATTNIPTSTRAATSTSTSTGTGTSQATATSTTASTSTLTPTQTAPPSGTATSTRQPSSTSTAPPSTATVAGSTLTPTVTTTPPECVQFPDEQPGNSVFYNYVQCLSCRGVISGYPDGTYREGNPITRGQIAKIVSNGVGFSDDPGGQIYSDVPPGSPFYAYINRLTRRGIVSGYPCPIEPGEAAPGDEPCTPENPLLFRPNFNATRGQLAKIVSNAAGYSESVNGQHYADVPPTGPGSEFYQWIMRLTNRGVMAGYPCGTQETGSGPCDSQHRPYFRPANEVTRGQAAKIVANTFFPNCQTSADK